MLGFLFFAIPSGIAAFVVLKSLHPFPDSAASSLAFVLFSDVWLAIFGWSMFHVLLFRTVEITPDGVKDELRLFGWRVRKRVVAFSQPHFVDAKDYRGGFPTSREMTFFLFVGPGCRISIKVAKERAMEIKRIVLPSTP
jgi:hypothetical protein